MKLSLVLLTTSVLTYASPHLSSRQDGNSSGEASADQWGRCPPVWNTISRELTSLFRSGNQCNDDARAAIRAVFHDCFPDGGCDGSLAIPAELGRSPNTRLTGTVNKLKSVAEKYRVSVADMLMFAGSTAVLVCPGGPTVKTYVGRKDAKSPAPEGQLPTGDVTGDEALQKFQQRGFSAQDLAALVGAHSAARQRDQDPSQAGKSLDSSPGSWDVKFYAETIAKKAPFSLPSDLSLANQTQVGPIFKKFAKSQGQWNAAFAPALAKMQLLGSSASKLVDCTSALPRARYTRDVKAAPINDRYS
ncbi:heme peroxidase [Tothia fuscella]|uniref:Peroxidase n=1 Tax=Tothia fuscella TaxID=1048955 RepID=A0A9P4P2M9_9PEZI|nr:heme peroxidase [Tothia fuscella]